VANRPLRVADQAADQSATLVDSCVLLDLALDDPVWGSWSADALAAAADAGPLVINPVIYAEVSVGYDKVEELDLLLPATDYRREALPYPAGFLAGKAFLRYRRAGGAKASPLPDFYIGAHAAVAGHRLLTRDKARYATYFPRVTLIAP
jgi:predicted nucleic acid-binding protein